MDFCISKSKPDQKRYDKKNKIGEDLWLACHTNRNIEIIEKEDALVLIAGTLFGKLRTSSEIQSRDQIGLGADALESDGTFIIVRFKDKKITFVTDAGGSIPVYWGYGPDGLAVGTLVHHVSLLTGLNEVDHVSVVDYLLYENVCYPYTWYKGIQVLPPASICTFDRTGNVDVHTYWQPQEPDYIYRPADAREWGDRLRAQVNRVVQSGINGQRSGRVLFSGGEDSRAIASLIPEDFDCVLTTVLDSKNREYKIAKRAARWMRRKFEWIPRPEDYYRSDIFERIDLIGPGRDFRHTHIFGSVAESFHDVDVILGGYLADSLFKTFYMTNIKKYPGKPDRLDDPAPDNIKILRNNNLQSIFRSDLVEAVLGRREEHHQRIKKVRPLTAGNWHSIWPVSSFRGLPHYLSCLKIGPRVIEPFLFSGVYRLAAEMPDTCRINRRAFRAAFSKAMGVAGWLPTSNRNIPRLDENLSALYSYIYARIQSVKYRFRGNYVLQKSWSPDHDGWHPVVPVKHFDQSSCENLYSNLEQVVSAPMLADFWHNGTSSPAMCIRTRALALGFKGIQVERIDT